MIFVCLTFKDYALGQSDNSTFLNAYYFCTKKGIALLIAVNGGLFLTLRQADCCT